MFRGGLLNRKTAPQFITIDGQLIELPSKNAFDQFFASKKINVNGKEIKLIYEKAFSDSKSGSKTAEATKLTHNTHSTLSTTTHNNDSGKTGSMPSLNMNLPKPTSTKPDFENKQLPTRVSYPEKVRIKQISLL